jgi:hypothetical protein
VPYAFAFRTLDNNLDLVLISVHLQPGSSAVAKARRKHELAAIANWVASNDDKEKDFIPSSRRIQDESATARRRLTRANARDSCAGRLLAPLSIWPRTLNTSTPDKFFSIYVLGPKTDIFLDLIWKNQCPWRQNGVNMSPQNGGPFYP